MMHHRLKKLERRQLTQNFEIATLDNGMTVLVRPMPEMRSAAMTLLVPAGGWADAEGEVGCSAVLSDLLFRGAGELNSRQLTEKLDLLGLHRAGGVGLYHQRFSATAEAGNVMQGLEVYADMLMKPHLPEEGFEPARDLALQGLAGLEDDPRQKLFVILKRVHFPDPLGRSTLGIEADLKALTLEKVRAQHKRLFTGKGAILAIAGNVTAEQVFERARKLFGGMPGHASFVPNLVNGGVRYHFEKQETEQTHIGLASETIAETHEDYYAVRVLAEVLGGGMSSRLFTEVREKRALCYAVSASYVGLADRGAIMAYSGTSNERAQATLDCLHGELLRLKEGVEEGEVRRAKVGLKSAVVMQGESTSAQSSSLAADYFIRGRVRTLEEITAAIDGITVEKLNAVARSRPLGPFTLVVLGPKELEQPKW